MTDLQADHKIQSSAIDNNLLLRLTKVSTAIHGALIDLAAAQQSFFSSMKEDLTTRSYAGSKNAGGTPLPMGP